MSATFNQQGQTVTGSQTNIGTLNFGAVDNKADFAKELQALKAEVEKSVSTNALDEDEGVDAVACVQKAINQVNKDEPDKGKLLENMNKLNGLVSGVSTLAGTVGTAIGAIGAIF